MISLVLHILHSPFHSNDDVIIIHSFNDNKFTIGRERRLCISLEWQKMTAPMYTKEVSESAKPSTPVPSNETFCEMAEANQTTSQINCQHDIHGQSLSGHVREMDPHSKSKTYQKSLCVVSRVKGIGQNDEDIVLD